MMSLWPAWAPWAARRRIIWLWPGDGCWGWIAFGRRTNLGGSSHGRTRIIREAYFEHTLYVPLVQRAYELWAELEQKSARQLLLRTGGLMIGPPEGVLVTGARQSAEDHKLAYQVLSGAEVRQRYPALQPTNDMVAISEPRAGILFPELAIQTHLELAARNGATLCFDEPVQRWEPQGNEVRVFTAKGTYRSRRLMLSAGAWIGSLIQELGLPLSVERQVLCWFEPASRPELVRPELCPIFIMEYEHSHFFYAFPDLGDGVKVAIHHQGTPTQPDIMGREILKQDTDAVRAVIERFVPRAAGRLLCAVACMYTNALDSHFIFGRHPSFPQVLIASPCSGHGFKFSPVIGEMAATILSDKEPPFDLSLFSPERFRSTTRGTDC
jgi:sarcosine oxidase